MRPELTEIQLDALKEATNIGVGHAAIALSQMLGKKIMIAVTRVDVVPSSTFLSKIITDKKAEVSAVYLETLGDVQGAMIFMFSKPSSLKLCDMLLFKRGKPTKFIDEKCQSAMKECGNILTGAFLAVLSDMLGLKVFNKAPYYAYDEAGLLTYAVCEEMFGTREEKMCLATEFIESSSKIAGSFVFIPAEKSMTILLNKLSKYKLTGKK